ncbi:MAG: 2-amino-4-hydroxy-6-hydroxymethyldihydropteridine diphosphokinase [Gemmatimonadetes bacterium]|nr:2-amino-4-hydroxy-6-hydroxymethyldihydropteridine diphosphokinase [Gemmatimonadota bacterium]MBT7861494.1 2-amino-4-hydroxy-6-hydroxymethyldihydropteridine diphosphokinase [Gemmatimonadota bacterium]
MDARRDSLRVVAAADYSWAQATTAWIGLGSNLDDSRALIEAALEALGAQSSIVLQAVSSAWETSPVGPVAQGAYLNAAAVLQTDQSATDLLDLLLSVEESLGRVRQERWGPRRIDLDLLLFGDELVDSPGLCVPHPYLMCRRFVLAPMIELAPGLKNPASSVRLIDALRALPAGEETALPVSPLRLPFRLPSVALPSD